MKLNYLAVLVVLFVLCMGLASAAITITDTPHSPDPLRLSDAGFTICADVTSDSTITEVLLEWQATTGRSGRGVMELENGQYCGYISTTTVHPVDGTIITCTITATNNHVPVEEAVATEIFSYETNDAPVILPISDQDAIEGVEFTMEIEATDDNPIEDLSISAANSTLPVWLSINPANPLQLIGTPAADGINEITVRVTDGETENALSATARFNITVWPAVEINPHSLEIEIDGEMFGINDELAVSPGDEVTVYFEYTNNFDATLAYVGTGADVSASGFAGFPYRNVCQWLDCLNGDWAIEPGQTGNDEFTFQVPLEISVDQFTLTLEVKDDGWWLPDTNFGDSFSLVFNVGEEMLGFSMEAELSAEEIACEDAVNLELTFVNGGQNAFVPQVLIYTEDQESAGHTFNPSDATFRNGDGEIVEELARETLPAISSGSRQSYRIPIDASELTVGEHSLFIYAVDPHFPGYIGAADDVALTINHCIPRTLEISNVIFNGETITENGQANSTVRPGDTVPVRMTITNYMSRPITGIKIRLIAEGEEELLSSLSGIAAGASSLAAFNIDVPLEVPANEYHIGLSTEGNDFVNPEILHEDFFGFTLRVAQEPADLFISRLTLDHTELACENSATLAVELTNRGSVTENDIIVTVRGGEVDFTSTPLTINRNSGNHDSPFLVPIPADELSSGTNTLTVQISYRDNYLHDQETIAISKSACRRSFAPTDTTPIVADDVDQEFSITLREEGFEDTISWTVANAQGATIVPAEGAPAIIGLTYTFNQAEPGIYTVTARIEADEIPVIWRVTVTDRPITSNFQTSDLSGDVDLASYQGFWMEKTNVGRIDFTQPVDLTGIFDLDQAVVISNSLIAVNAPGLEDRTATITLFRKAFTNPVIQVSGGFNQGPYSECTQCQGSNVQGNFVVTVPGFSTYQIVEAVPAGLTLSDIAFNNIERGNNLTMNVNIANQGTFESLTDVQVSLVGVNSRYSAVLNPASLGSLGPGASASTTFTLTVPSDENSGSHSIGSLKVTGVNEDGQTITASKTITLNPKSYLTIKSVSTGDGLKLNEMTEIEVSVQNDYTTDMENVRIETTILDVDGDNIEAESEEFDLKKGDDEKVTLEFDLTGQNVDESEYSMEIVVEGEADDDTEHGTTRTETVKVDREKHQVILEKAALNVATLQCDRLATLQATIKNVGENDEDDVTITIRNDKLELEESQENIELENYASSDNDYRASFNLDLTDAEVGKYPIKVEVYRGGSLEDSAEAEVEIKECLTLGQTSRTQPLAAGELAEQIQRDLQQGLQARQEEQVIKASFRESGTYALLLGILVLLLLIAVLLAIAVAFKRR